MQNLFQVEGTFKEKMKKFKSNVLSINLQIVEIVSDYDTQRFIHFISADIYIIFLSNLERNKILSK